jgi:hypothetical protein
MGAQYRELNPKILDFLCSNEAIFFLLFICFLMSPFYFVTPCFSAIYYKSSMQIQIILRRKINNLKSLMKMAILLAQQKKQMPKNQIKII